MSTRPVVMNSSTSKDLTEHWEQVRRASFTPHKKMGNLDALDAKLIDTSLTMVTW